MGSGARQHQPRNPDAALNATQRPTTSSHRSSSASHSSSPSTPRVYPPPSNRPSPPPLRNQRAASNAAWKQNTFATDARTGKTTKWKPMNTHTYQHRQAAVKWGAVMQDASSACMDLSGLIYKPL